MSSSDDGFAVFIEPLTMLKPDGTRYERLPHVEAQLRRVYGLPESQRIMGVTDLYSECIVYMIRRKSGSEELRSRLVEEIMVRIERLARRMVWRLGESDSEEICSDVQMQILKLILPDKLDESADFFEVVFAPGVKTRTSNAKRSYERSITGGRRGLDSSVGADENSDELDLLKRLADSRPSPEETVIASKDQELCRDAIEKVRGKVKPQDLEAALLFHCEDVPMSSKDPEKDTLARRYGLTEPAIRNRIDAVMKALRNLLLGGANEN